MCPAVCTAQKACTQTLGARYNDRYTLATVKHPPSVMIWGAMSTKGTAGLFFLPTGTTTNGARYVEKDKTLDWPGNSPDLNPFENLWTLLKDKVAERLPTSMKDLEMVINMFG